MVDYKSMYLRLFNSVTDAIQILMEAQIATEDMFIEGNDTLPVGLVENDHSTQNNE